MQVTFNLDEKVLNELKNKAQKDGVSLDKESEQLILAKKNNPFMNGQKKLIGNQQKKTYH